MHAQKNKSSTTSSDTSKMSAVHRNLILLTSLMVGMVLLAGIQTSQSIAGELRTYACSSDTYGGKSETINCMQPSAVLDALTNQYAALVELRAGFELEQVCGKAMRRVQELIDIDPKRLGGEAPPLLNKCNAAVEAFQKNRPHQPR